MVGDHWEQLLYDFIVVGVEELGVLGELVDDLEGGLSELFELRCLALV